MAAGARIDRIVILGRAGSGKSTLARRLARESGAPAFHTDLYGWTSGWRHAPFEEYRAQIASIAAQARWIIDGNSPRTFDLRFPRADAIILLQLPRSLCFARMTWRTMRYLGRRRPTSAPGCRDGFRRSLFATFLAFDRTMLPSITEALTDYDAWPKLMIVRSAKEAGRLTAAEIARKMRCTTFAADGARREIGDEPQAAARAAASTGRCTAGSSER